MSEQLFDRVIHTPTSIIIPNVKYRGKREAYEVRRRVLPARNFEGHLEATLKARESGDYGVGDAPLYFALFRALYEQRENVEQKKEVERAREFLSRKINVCYLTMLTTIDYRINADAIVTHCFGKNERASLEVELAEDDGWLNHLEQVEADGICRGVYAAENREEVDSVMQWITEKDVFFYRKPWDYTSCSVAGLGADSDSVNLSCGRYSFVPNSALGVRVASPGSLKRYQTYRTDFAKTMQNPLLDSFGKSAEIEIDVTETFSAQTPESYQRKVRIVDALQGREDLSDAEVLAVEEILKRKREEKQ